MRACAGCILPKGSFVGVPVYGVHHQKAVWGDDADTFVPDRWLAEDAASQKRAKNSYFAFGGGMRACPGSRFALLEIKCTLIKIFQNFTLELAPKQVCFAHRLLWSENFQSQRNWTNKAEPCLRDSALAIGMTFCKFMLDISERKLIACLHDVCILQYGQIWFRFKGRT